MLSFFVERCNQSCLKWEEYSPCLSHRDREVPLLSSLLFLLFLFFLFLSFSYSSLFFFFSFLFLLSSLILFYNPPIQIPAYIMSKSGYLTIVVSPLLSLMADQVAHLPAPIRGVVLNTSQTQEEQGILISLSEKKRRTNLSS